MRTILVPTDYSEAARNATYYAAELSKHLAAKLALFHAYHVPMRVAAGGGNLPASGEEMEAEEVRRLRNYIESIRDNYPATSIGQVVRAGFAVEEIVDYAGDSDVDLVVMGTKGEGSHSEIFGSIASTVIREAHTPVLVVPEDAQFKDVSKIALAYDYSGISDPSVLNILIDMVKAFGSRLMIVDVLKRESDPHGKHGDIIERLASQVDHEFYFPVSDDPADAVLHFIEENNVDILATIPHKHGFFERMLGRSFTKKVALHTHVPLLALPG
jgi:nucleotide-binding universal stress UspA family protein